MRAFDLVVVGGGSAGFAAALRGTELGATVALVEGNTVGGTCVNVGCIPSKTLIRAAEAQHRRVHHGFAGIPASGGGPDWGAVRDAKDALVRELRQSKYWDVLRSHEAITLFEGRATLAAGPSVRLSDGRSLHAGRIVVATGASPRAPAIPGLAESGFLDSASAMALEQLPASLIVIGGGAIGLELGQLFARLGVAVVVVEAEARLLPAEDAALGEGLEAFLRSEGLEVCTGARVTQVRREGRTYAVRVEGGGMERLLHADELLVATGRRANSGGIGLDAVGVQVRADGAILVDEHLRTSNSTVYAAGDVLGDPMFVYVAAYGGSVAAENALAGDQRRYDLGALPRVTFTDPQAASVGLTAAQAEGRGVRPLVAELPLVLLPRALAARDTRGFVKLVADARSRRLLGAHILAPEAGEMIAEAVLAVRFALTIEDLTATFHPYLTLAEGIRLAAQAFTKDVARLSCCAA